MKTTYHIPFSYTLEKTPKNLSIEIGYVHSRIQSNQILSRIIGLTNGIVPIQIELNSGELKEPNQRYLIPPKTFRNPHKMLDITTKIPFYVNYARIRLVATPLEDVKKSQTIVINLEIVGDL